MTCQKLNKKWKRPNERRIQMFWTCCQRTGADNRVVSVDFNVIFTCTTKKRLYTVCELASMSAQTQRVCNQVGLYLTAWVTCNVLAAHFSGDVCPDDT